jgi:glycine betaine/proline transport system substrate-binding protein
LYLLTVSVSSCKDSDKKEEKTKKKKEVSIFMPIGLTELRLLIWQKQHLKQMILTTITNLAPGMIFGELSKDDSKGCFLMPGFRIRTKITGCENW